MELELIKIRMVPSITVSGTLIRLEVLESTNGQMGGSTRVNGEIIK